MTGGTAEEGVDLSPGTPVELTAQAKLTLSLRVTGIRRCHLEGPGAVAGALRRPRQSGGPGAGCGRTERTRTPDQEDPSRRGPRRGVGRRCGRPALGRLLRSGRGGRG